MAGSSKGITSLISGFVGGTLLSGVALAGLSLVLPPVPGAGPNVQSVATPRFPDLAPPVTEENIDPQESVDTPVAEQPNGPTSTPAVDPDLPQTEIALNQVEAEQNQNVVPASAPRPSAQSATAPAAQSAAALDSPETSSVGLSNTSNPTRVRAGSGASPGAGLSVDFAGLDENSISLPRPSSSSAPARPQSASIQPPTGAPQRELAPQTDTAPPPPAPVRLPDAEVVTEAVPPSQAPRTIYAASFSDTGERPLLSVILIDEGEDLFPMANMSALSLPITFAVPIEAPDAVERAAAFRAAGFEVLALLPDRTEGQLKGLSDSDLNSRLAGLLAAVPEVIGLMDRDGGDIPRDNILAKQVLDYMALSGHALVTYKGTGFNQIERAAGVQGVANATVQRVLDSNQGAVTMRNTLERVALNARSTGSSVVVGVTDPETITTLLTWVLTSGNRTIALSPVTALMERNARGG